MFIVEIINKTDALAPCSSGRWLGTAESPCGDLEAQPACVALDCEKPVLEHMVGQCERYAVG